MYAVETLNPEPRLCLEAQSANWRIKGQGRWNLKLTLKIQNWFRVYGVSSRSMEGAHRFHRDLVDAMGRPNYILCSAAFDT